MSGELAGLRDTWQAFYRERCAEDIRQLADDYPRDRSLYVDVLELYAFDEPFTRQLFGAPDRFLEAGTDALRDLHEPFDRVNVRLTNHPGLLGLDGVRSRHVSELVTVEAAVAAVDGVQSAVAEAVYACGRCGSLAGRRPDARLRPPVRCDECGAEGAFDLRHDRSTFVDVQRVELESIPEETAEAARLDALIDDDLVGTVAVGDQLLVTGIVRLDGDEPANRFDFYLDAVSVSHEPSEARRSVENVTDELREAIQSRWELLADR